MAKIIDVSAAYPSLIESGERADIGSGVAAGIAKAFGSTIDYLVTGMGEPPTPEQAEAAITQARADLAIREAERKAAEAADSERDPDEDTATRAKAAAARTGTGE